MKSRSFLGAFTAILSFLFFRLAFPLALDLWFTIVLDLNRWLSILFSIFWYVAPVLCTPFWIYAFFFVAPAGSLSTCIFILGLAYIFNRPFCILPGTIPLLLVRWLGSSQVNSHVNYWRLPATFPAYTSKENYRIIEAHIRLIKNDSVDVAAIMNDSDTIGFVIQGCRFSLAENQAVIHILEELLPCFSSPSSFKDHAVPLDEMPLVYDTAKKLQEVLFQIGSLYGAYRYVDKFPFRSVHAEYIDNALKRLYPSVYMCISKFKDIYK